jgi:Tetracyclin repressor-like, C-terminal domain
VKKTADLIFILIEGAYYYLSMVSDKSEYEGRIDHYQKTVMAMLNVKDNALALKGKL